jgi:DNA-binding PadR family transcriptional regulator
VSITTNQNPNPTIAEKHVVLLGLIAEEPIHAYGLEEKIRNRYMTEWTEIGFSSIYRVLSQLEDDGLIESRLEHEGQGATRKVYTIKDSGRALLTRGVLEHLGRFRPVKNPFLVALAYISHAPRAEAVARLRARLAEVDGWVTQLAAITGDDALRTARLASCDDSAIGKVLVLDHAIRHLRVEREFLAEALEVLSRSVGENPPSKEVRP